MKAKYRDGLAEVDIILGFADQESLDKIPESFKTFIIKNKSKYISKIDPQKSLNEQKLLYETKVILSIMYRDYWSSEEEREQILLNEKEELKKIENLSKNKYNYENLFRNAQKTQNIAQEETEDEGSYKSLMIKESLLEKILNKIKSFFKLGNNNE